jgi:hypothetical protein
MWLHRNLGNYILKAYCEGKVSLEQLLSYVQEDEKELLQRILPLNVFNQVSGVFKLGELLETPEEDNQQPS